MTDAVLAGDGKHYQRSKLKEYIKTCHESKCPFCLLVSFVFLFPLPSRHTLRSQVAGTCHSSPISMLHADKTPYVSPASGKRINVIVCGNRALSAEARQRESALLLAEVA